MFYSKNKCFILLKKKRKKKKIHCLFLVGNPSTASPFFCVCLPSSPLSLSVSLSPPNLAASQVTPSLTLSLSLNFVWRKKLNLNLLNCFSCSVDSKLESGGALQAPAAAATNSGELQILPLEIYKKKEK